MERRSFLASLAAAPMAALIPWTKIVQQPHTILSTATGPTTMMITSGGNGYVYQLVDRNYLRLDLADPAHVDLDRVLAYAQGHR